MSQKGKYVLGFILAALFAIIIFIPMSIHNQWDNWRVIGNVVTWVAVYGIMCWSNDPFLTIGLGDLPPKLLWLHILSYMLMSLGISFTVVLADETPWLYALGVVALLSFAFIQRYLLSKFGKKSKDSDSGKA